MPPVARTIALAGKTHGLARRPPVAERALDPVRPRQEVGDRALHVDLDPGARPPGPGASGSSRGRSGRRRGRAADRSGRRTAAGGSGRRGSGRRRRPRARARGPGPAPPWRGARPSAGCSGACRRPSCRGSGSASCRGVDVAHRRRDAALGHHRVGLAEERLADEPDRRARAPRPRSPPAGPAPPAPMTRTSWGYRSGRVAHRRMAGSTMIPSASRRT